MATGRERRAELLNQRLRGAQRVGVEDESFSIDIAGIGGLAQPSSPTRRQPQASAKRRSPKDAPSTALRDSSSASRRGRRPARGDVYDLPETSKESVGQVAAASSPTKQHTTQISPETRTIQRSSVARSVASRPGEEEPDELEAVPEPSSVRLPTSHRSPAISRVSGHVIDEVEESPANAPGSGRRRIVRMSGAASSTARLHDALNTDDAAPASSSPLARKARRSDASVAVRRSTMSRHEANEEVDELSPDRPQDKTIFDDAELSESHPVESERTITDPDAEAPSDGVELEEHEEAEKIDEAQAAKTLGKKRPRRGMRAQSPELGSGDIDEEAEPDEQEDEQPVPKRRRGRPSKSPAQQKQPAAKPKSKQPSSSRPKSKQPPKPKDPTSKRRQSDDANDTAIEITVQRFINNKPRPASDIDAPDPLHSGIPFANHSGESVVDVFAQVCEEVIASTLEQFRLMGEAAGDVSKKKECRVKMRAIEAYREELSTRLLQHTIHLNHWHSLRKRVRHVQKEKISLREEIIRLKGEREQVALQMDAVRIKHEADNRDSTYRLNASALMHDIDLAVEQGREAPELSRAAQKHAELGNLELLVARVAEEASSGSFTGGMLSQVKDFNAFLERAAAALESR